jgi:hypothetical protein
MSFKLSEAASRYEERHRREDDAPRLRTQVPLLVSLRLELAEFRQGGTTPQANHTRHVVVERAASLFVFPCGERECDGCHDLTREVLRQLSESAEHFEGEDECHGMRWGATCHRRLRYRVHAGYGSLG